MIEIIHHMSEKDVIRLVQIHTTLAVKGYIPSWLTLLYNTVRS